MSPYIEYNLSIFCSVCNVFRTCVLCACVYCVCVYQALGLGVFTRAIHHCLGAVEKGCLCGETFLHRGLTGIPQEPAEVPCAPAHGLAAICPEEVRQVL